MSDPWLVLRMKSARAFDSLRLAARARRPELEIDPEASRNLAVARFNVAPGARLRIAAGVETERIPGRLHFVLWPGAEVEIGTGTWLRTEVGDVHIVAFAGARLSVGPESMLNACHVSAKKEVVLGRHVFVGSGSRIFDADQHDLDDERPERMAPVAVGDHAWIASDCTVLRGVTIGEHSVVGTRSIVTRDVPAHSVAYGQPAVAKGPVGDRSKAR